MKIMASMTTVPLSLEDCDGDGGECAALHQAGCSFPEAGTGVSIHLIAHGDASGDASGDETSIKSLAADEGNIGRKDCNARKEEVGGRMYQVIWPSLSGYDTAPLQYGHESETYDDRDQAGRFSSGSNVDATATSRCIHQKRHPGRTADAKYKCVTQTHGCAEVRIGWDGEIPRWRKGSELSYVVCLESFPAPLSTVVEKSMKAATDMWEGIGVSFKQVRRDTPATFAVTYQDRNNGKAYACSFFPNDSWRELTVYGPSLQEPNCLVNILAHEVGHILGLRHEFAHEKEKGYPSVLLGSKNSQSVMNYFDHPRDLQVKAQDLEELKRLYAYDQTEYEGLDILDIDPEVRPNSKNSRRRGHVAGLVAELR